MRIIVFGEKPVGSENSANIAELLDREAEAVAQSLSGKVTKLWSGVPANVTVEVEYEGRIYKVEIGIKMADITYPGGKHAQVHTIFVQAPRQTGLDLGLVEILGKAGYATPQIAHFFTGAEKGSPFNQGDYSMCPGIPVMPRTPPLIGNPGSFRR